MPMIGSEIARMGSLHSRAIAVRNAVDDAATEMTTGEKLNRYAAAGGNLTRLFALEQSLGRNSGYSATISLTEERLTLMQDALDRIVAPANTVAINLTAAAGLGNVAEAVTHATSARANFATTVSLLNSQFGGESLFAGTATDRPALAPAADILADIDGLAGADAAATQANIDAYFTAPGGGFYARYTGSAESLTPAAIGEGQAVDYGVQAIAPEIVALLKGQALAGVIAGGAAGLPGSDKLALAAAAGGALLQAQESVQELRGRVGAVQERVERAKAARVAERSVLELSQAHIVGIDPLEAGSNYQRLETQLNAIYTITARLLNLRFINFMS